MSKSLHGGVRSHALDLSSLPISRFVGSLRDSPHPLNAQLGAMSENDLDAASAFVADESLNVVLGQARSLIQLLSAQVASEKKQWVTEPPSWRTGSTFATHFWSCALPRRRAPRMRAFCGRLSHDAEEL